MDPIIIGAIDFEYYNCFENLTKDEFYKANGQSPKTGFIESYEALINDDVQTVRKVYGYDLADTFIYPEEKIQDTIQKLEEKYKECLELQKLRRELSTAD